eukprot:jgi/Botrbrau1/17171/Bobra.0157s0063.1
MPDFFSGKGSNLTPKLYREYRNAIINKYRENVERHLPSKELSTLLDGEPHALVRVWDFLDKWGLINFQAKDGPPRPESSSQVLFEVAPAGKTDAVHIGGLAPRAALLDLPRQGSARGALTAAAGGNEALDLITRPDLYGRTALKAPVAQPKFFCNAMPWMECTQSRYHCVKEPDIDLCPQAFAEGRFPPGCSAKDFIKIDQPENQGNEWTDQEDLMLLEAVEMYGEGWGDIAEHVGTKSQAQCIMRLIQLPIEDPYIAQMALPGPAHPISPAQPEAAAPAGAAVPPSGSGEEPATADAAGPAPAPAPAPVPGAAPAPQPPQAEADPGGAANGINTAASGIGSKSSEDVHMEPADELPPKAPIPFEDAGNPIMTQVAFLAAVVGPQSRSRSSKSCAGSADRREPGSGRCQWSYPPLPPTATPRPTGRARPA